MSDAWFDDEVPTDKSVEKAGIISEAVFNALEETNIELTEDQRLFLYSVIEYQISSLF